MFFFKVEDCLSILEGTKCSEIPEGKLGACSLGELYLCIHFSGRYHHVLAHLFDILSVVFN